MIARRTRRACCALNHHLVGRTSRERNRSGEHLVEDDAQRVDVGALIERDSLHLLGRHVVRRADDPPRFGQAGILERLGQSEVGDGHAPAAVDENVLRLQVAMNHALLVRRLQPFADLPEDVHGLRKGQPAFAAHHRREVLAGDVLHGQKLHAAGLAEVIDAEDVLVRDVAGELNLAFESLQDRRVTGKIEADDFQSDVAIELTIAGEVDLPHPTLPELLHDVVPLPEIHPFGNDATRSRRMVSRAAGKSRLDERLRKRR